MKSISLRHVVATYRFYAPLYDRVFGAVLHPGRLALAAATRTAAPESLLEVGVGTGLTLKHYPRKCRIVGVDISEEMLAIARRRAAGLADNDIELKVMDAEALAFADNSFDCVTLPYVLSVTPDPDRLVEEVRRVCRKDGTIILVNHFSGAGSWRLLEKAMKNLAALIGFRSDFDYDEHVRKHDWQVESVEKANLFGLSRVVRIRNV